MPLTEDEKKQRIATLVAYFKTVIPDYPTLSLYEKALEQISCDLEPGGILAWSSTFFPQLGQEPRMNDAYLQAWGQQEEAVKNQRHDKLMAEHCLHNCNVASELKKRKK